MSKCDTCQYRNIIFPTKLCYYEKEDLCGKENEYKYYEVDMDE